jgi:sulfite exporter TauE/SafE
MTRIVKAWEYLYGGLAFLVAGLAELVGYAYTMSSGSTFQGPLLIVGFGFGATILGIGVYYLWKFEQVHKRELHLAPSRTSTDKPRT